MGQHKFYDPIDNNLVTKLGINAQLCGYCCGTTGRKIFGHIYETDKETYDKIKTILMGRHDVEIKEGDKVFVLPGYPLTQERIKEYLKRIKATLTSDISKATYIAGGSSFEEHIGFYYGSQQNLTTTIMFNVDGVNEVLEPWALSNVPEELEEIKEMTFYISDFLRVEGGFGTLDRVVRPTFFLTPALVEILYNLLSRKLPVGNLDCLAKKANSSVKLDSEFYENVDAMLGSKNSNDVLTGLNLLMYCDYSSLESEYYLWKLARKHSNAVFNMKHSKTLAFFLKDSNWYSLAGTDENNFLQARKEQGILTKQVVTDLLPVILRNTVESLSSWIDDDFFDAHVTETEVTYSFNPDWIEIYKNSKDAESKPQ